MKKNSVVSVVSEEKQSSERSQIFHFSVTYDKEIIYYAVLTQRIKRSVIS